MPFKDPEKRREWQRNYMKLHPRNSLDNAKLSKEYREKFPEKAKAACKEWRRNNKEYDAARSKKWWDEHPEKRKEYAEKYKAIPGWEKNQQLKSDHKITLSDFSYMRNLQNNRCAVCQEIFVGTPCVDHCHNSKIIRALLCQACNKGLGNFKDNTAILMKAVNYLDEVKSISNRFEVT